MRKLAILPIMLFVACATATSTPPPSPAAQTDCNPGLAIVNASLWNQSAAEYDAAALSAWNGARRAVEAGLAQNDARPAAIILDADETTLDNTEFEARMVHMGKTYDSAEWSKWIVEANARAVPGSVEFLQWAASRGVTAFYITNRKADEEAGTTENLRKLGFPLKADSVLVRGERPEWAGRDKSPRREWVASQYRVLAVVGDDLNDFVNTQGASAEQRDALVRSHASEWGTRWFVIPNPIYGSWEDVITGEGSPCEKLQRKIEALR
ncbi:MAG TPA: HAD family acid phosphatase [Thermoanaerobaculia bacterium]|nr:HAD family acid phosphatase [Thermoanaerobaculia bacterium]